MSQMESLPSPLERPADEEKRSAGIAWRGFSLVGLTLILGMSLIVAATHGPLHIPMDRVLAIFKHAAGFSPTTHIDPIQSAVLLELRLPRLLMALLVGAAMAMAGAAMQALFRNPLADPGIVGVSSGAALGAVLWIVLAGQFALLGSISAQLGAFALPAAAFIGGLGTTAIIYSTARFGHAETQTFILLLAGIAIAALTGAATGMLTYMADDQQLRSITFWTMGSLGGADWSGVRVSALIILPGILLLYTLHRLLDVLLLGETVAGHLGFEMNVFRPLLVLLVALLMAASVAMTGIIGFIGLMAPHIARALVGPGHRLMLPAAALIGAWLLLVGDMAARDLISPAEIPIGILTALLGGPFFLALLFMRKVRI